MPGESSQDQAGSDDRFRLLAEGLPVQIWTAAPDGRLDYVTERTAGIFGLSAAQLLVDGWQNVVHPDDLTSAVEHWTHALRTGEPYEVEFRLKLAGGAYAWHLARAIPQRSEGGAIVRWLGTNTEIQRQHDQQDRLAEQNALLALEAEVGVALTRTATLDQALGACAEAIVRRLGAAFARIWTLAEDGRTLELRASAGLYTHLDGSHARVPVGHLKIGRIAANRLAHLTNAVIGDPEVGDQAWAVRERMTAFAGYPLLLGDALVGVVATFSRQRFSQATLAALSSLAHPLALAVEKGRADKRLREREEWFSTTLAGIGDGVIATDRVGSVSYLNGVAEALTGWSSSEAAGRPLAEVFAILNEETRAPVESPADKVMRERTVANLANHTLLIRRDGTETPIDDSAAPLFGADGELTGVVLVFRDASGRRRSEKERATLLAQEHAARVDAERATRSMDAFLANISHELRTPLNAMLGWTRLLRAGQVSDDARPKALATIERNATIQSRLIEDLLDVSRIVSGKLKIEIGPIDLAQIVEAALDVVRPAAEAKGVEVRTVFESPTMPHVGDAARLQQVVWNLLANAVKFTPGGGSVTARLRRLGSGVEIAVVDSGQGIAPSLLAHVFERFRQADGATAGAQGGLGLGLAIVKHLVELHGGRVRAESEGPGRGAAFVVDLPFSERVTQVRHQADAVSEAPELAGVSAELGGVRALLVDDDPDGRELLTEVLSMAGAAVTPAASVAEALGTLDGARYDVVLSDIGMPGQDGYAFARAMQERLAAGKHRPPMIALTAYARTEERARALRAGFDMHVTKPIDPEGLVAAVVAVLRRPGSGR